MSAEYRISIRNYAPFIAFSLLWFAVLIGVTLVRDVPHDAEPVHIVAALGVVALALAPAFATALLPYKATLDDYGTLELESILHTRRLRVARIRALDYDEGYIQMRSDAGSTPLPADENFRDLLARILVLNPAINVDDEIRELLGTPS